MVWDVCLLNQFPFNVPMFLDWYTLHIVIKTSKVIKRHIYNTLQLYLKQGER